MTPMGRVAAILAAVLVAVGAWLPWSDPGTDNELTTHDMNVLWLLGIRDDQYADIKMTSVVVLLMMCTFVLLAGAASGSRLVTLVGGFASLAVVVLWVIREGLVRDNEQFRLFHEIGNGPLLVLLGSVIAIVAGAFLRVKQPKASGLVVG